MNSYGKLTWELTHLAQHVQFMDLTLSNTETGIHTRIFEKKLNLYLYIPPHLAHAPGVIRGLVTGMTSQIFCLTTYLQDQQIALHALFLRLCNRGYSSETLRTLFAAALAHQERPTFNKVPT
jgi:hypothetical protein